MTITRTETRFCSDTPEHNDLGDLGWSIMHRLREAGDGLRAVPVVNPLDQNSIVPWHPMSIENGDLGVALALSAADHFDPDGGWDLAAHHHITEAVNSFSRLPNLGVGAFAGTASLAFALDALSRDGERYQSARRQVESYLASRTYALLETWNPETGTATDSYDLIAGVSGAAWYVVQSGRRSREMIDMAQSVITALCERACTPPPAGFWTTSHQLTSVEREHHPHLHDGYINLGLAHGIAGPLLVLGHARAAGFDVDPGAIEAIRATLGNHCERGELGPDIGYHATPASIPRAAPTRAAWCYGNAGLALAAAATEPSQGDSLPSAHELLETLNTRSVEDLGIDNPSLCHGYGGLALIESALGRSNAITPSTRGVERLVGVRDPAQMYGFRNHHLPGVQSNSPGLLEGAGGTAIALLELTSHSRSRSSAARMIVGGDLSC